jgi:hypothetical protein
MKQTLESVLLTRKISDEINNMTFHHHYYVLYDIANEFSDSLINYVEIGCYGGGSACLMLQRPNTNVVSIDLGEPISPNIVQQNVKKLNTLNNNYNYIQANSQKQETVDQLKTLVNDIDILFIDGDHRYNGVINDFNLYSNLVKSGGYIIFDDYNDHQYSPEVKSAVDDLLTNNLDYEIIGTIPNTFGARPDELKDGNCFVIKKKEMGKLAIVIPTYRRSDNKTPEYLTRALLSVKNQTYQNYKVFLIGDNYENNDEFIKIGSTIIDSKKITYINLPKAIEREKYQSGENLWASGGVNATNYGIDLALNDDYEYICHLDHDDWWEPNHLDLIKDHLSSDFTIIATKSTYSYGGILPTNNDNPYYPENSNLIHSATCVNFKEIPLRYRDVFADEGYPYAADADLWNRLSKYMLENNKSGYLINEITCHHDEEGFTRK